MRLNTAREFRSDSSTSLCQKIREGHSSGCGAGSIVGIAIGYGLDGPGSNPGGGEIFRACPDRPRGPTSLLYNGYRVFSGGKERPGRDADPSPLLVSWSRKSIAITPLPLRALRTGQSLSACTRVHFTYTFYILSNVRFFPITLLPSSL